MRTVLRRTVASLALLVGAVAAALAQDVVKETADKALAARAAGDSKAFEEATRHPLAEPWLVCIDLCRRGEVEVAIALAETAKGADVAALPALIRQRGGKIMDAREVEILRPAGAAAKAGAFEKALSLLDGVEVEAGSTTVVSLHFYRATCLRGLRRLDESAANWEAAATAADGLGWLLRASHGYDQAARDFLAVRDPESAERCFRRQGEVEQKRGRMKGVASATMNVGLCQSDRGDYTAARESIGRGVAMMQVQGDLGGQARGLLNLGNIALATGDLAEAERVYGRSRELAAKAGLPDIEAGCTANLGRVKSRRGDLGGYVEDTETALAAYERLGMKEEAATATMNLGTYFFSVGDHGRALDHYRRALALGDATGHRPMPGLLLNLALALESNGHREEAAAMLARAEDAARASNDVGALRRVLMNKAQAMPREAGSGTRVAAAEEAVSLTRAVAGADEVAMALTVLAEARAAAGDVEAGLAAMEEALPLAREAGSVEAEARVHGTAAVLLVRLGRDADAARRARQCVERLGEYVDGLPDVDAASVRGVWAWIYVTGTASALRAGLLDEAVFFVESGRGGALLEGMGGRATLAEAALPVALLQARREAAGAETGARAEYERARAAGDLRGAAAARKVLESAHAAHLAAVGRIQREAKSAAAVLYPRAAPVAAIAAALAPTEALVLYQVVDEEMMALVVTTRGTRVARLGSAAAVREAADALVPTATGVDVAPAAEALAAKVWAPLALEAATQRVIVSPAGPVSVVPFCALDHGREIAYVPSGTVLLRLRQGDASSGRGVLAFGDPAYGGGHAGAARGPTLTALPHTRAEATAVGTTAVVGSEATETALRAHLADGTRWRGIHLACHGLLNASEPTQSALALAPDAKNDGVLSLLDVYGLRVDADLVTLSACDTGRGSEVVGEGVLGFPRGFLLAGSRRVVVSLWKVDDEATRALMEEFYSLWNPASGTAVPAPEALRRAQERVRSQEKWRHPAFWAAWQCWGRGD